MSLKDKLFRYFYFFKLDNTYHLAFKDKWNWFNVSISNPFKNWWKARKYFKAPKTEIHFFCTKQSAINHCPYGWRELIGKFLSIELHDVRWKDKWNSPRFEYNACIFISLFRRFGFMIYPRIYGIDEFGQKIDRDMYYWEYLLDYVHYTNKLKIDNFWVSSSQIVFKTEYGKAEDGSEDKKTPYSIPIMTHLFSLNKKGLKKFKQEYENSTNRNSSNDCSSNS